MPPSLPPMTAAGWAEPPPLSPDFPLVPITMATTTAMITTAAMTAPMMTGLGPFFGAAAAIFLEASGRMWLISSLSEQTMVKAVCRTRTHDEPRRTGCEPRVAQNVRQVLRLGRGDASPAAKTATVDVEAAHPRRDDADEEGQHQEAAYRCR